MARKPRAKELGLTGPEYDRRLVAQGGGCAICGNPPKTRRLDCDHDHRTGEIRGLLCSRCNRWLPAWARATWFRAAALYLSYGARPVGRPWIEVADVLDNGPDLADAVTAEVYTR